MPTSCPGCPQDLLISKQTWDDIDAFDATARKLAGLFHENFAKYVDAASDAIKAVGPRTGREALA